MEAYTIVINADRYKSIEAAAKRLDLRIECDQIADGQLYARLWYKKPGDLFRLGALTERYFVKGIEEDIGWTDPYPFRIFKK